MRWFEFVACSELIQILGLRADDERKLAEILAEVPLDSVHYHTHGHFLRHGFVGAPYPNDFATWAATEVRDRVLGERLGVVSPLDFPTLEDLREEILTIIDDHLSRLTNDAAGPHRPRLGVPPPGRPSRGVPGLTSLHRAA